MNTFTVSETDLVRTLGVPRSILRKKRATLERGVDWDLIGGQVLWTAASAASVASDLTSHQGPVTPPEKDAPETLLVAASNLPNPILLACVKEGEPIWNRSSWRMVRVVAHCRGLFVAGMRLRAEKLPGEQAWRFIGPPDTDSTMIRYPRRTGQW